MIWLLSFGTIAALIQACLINLCFVFVFIFRREIYFKIWLPCCGILLVLLLHYYRYALYVCIVILSQVYCVVMIKSITLIYFYHAELPHFTILFCLQEIVSIYPVLSSPNLTTAQSNRVCNAFALFQVR